jgi:hypothetical protein
MSKSFNLPLTNGHRNRRNDWALTYCNSVINSELAPFDWTREFKFEVQL